MKILKAIKRVLWEIYDFFCGDWRNFVGLAVSVVILSAVGHIDALSFLRPVACVLYPVLIGLALTYTLNKAAKK